MDVACTTEAKQEKYSFEALDFVSSSSLHWKAGRFHRLFLLLFIAHPHIQQYPARTLTPQVRDRICLPRAWGSGLGLSAS